MKLILNEEQYNRLFNNDKRKMIITESQYNKLLFESVLKDNLLKVEKSDTIEVVRGKDKMFFKVVSKNGHEFMMINCDNGVYKNAYFHIKGDSLYKNSLVYSLAQNSDIDDENPWETVGSDVWRKSTFKNIDTFSVHKSNSDALECNLSTISDKRFSVDMTTGSVTDGEDEKDDSKNEPNSKIGINPMNSVITTFNLIKSDYKYNITIGEYKENIKKNKNGKIANNIKDGSILINVISRTGKRVDFEVLSVEGESGDIYKHLVNKDSTFVIDKKSITIDEESKSVFKMFTLDIETFKDGEGEDGNRAKEDDAIANIMQFVEVGPYDKNDSNNIISLDLMDEPGELTDAEMKLLIKKLVTDNKFLQDTIISKPNHFSELLGLSRKKGILPIKGRMGKWYNDVSSKVNIIKNFPINKIFTANLDRNSFNIKNEGLASDVNFNTKFKLKSLKPNTNNSRVRFGTNFRDTINEDEDYEYNIQLLSEEENEEEFFIYKIKLYKTSNEDDKSVYVGIGTLRILKDIKN
tara:strand:- start:11111 stop:12676 length:1566 start_codon:yes stop_codon:yes gene_type:complete